MRSYLLTPADSATGLQQAATSGTDILLIDLTSSLTSTNLQQARKTASDFLSAHHESTERSSFPKLYVQVHELRTGLIDDDLTAIIPACPDGILLPRSISGRDISALDVKLQAFEALAGLPQGKIAIMAMATQNAASPFQSGQLCRCQHTPSSHGMGNRNTPHRFGGGNSQK